MARPKKGQLAQFQVPMVSSTDFATIQSTITASDFNSGATVKFYGCNHGGSAATTSGTVSKIASLIRSGVFRLTLKGTENNYDNMTLRINKTGCAEQILEWTNDDYDDSDIYSLLSDLQSDFQSRVPKRVATDSQLSDLASDLKSYLAVMSGVLSDTYSALSDMQSDFQSRVPKRVATDSQLSDLISDAVSDLKSFMNAGVPMTASDMSDLRSAIAAGAPIQASDMSDLRSAIAAGPAATITASDISDIASAVWAYNSALRIAHLGASDLSDLRSAIAAGPAGALSVSDISDIASAVKVILASDISDILSAAQQTNSRVLLNQSRISDVYSMLSDFQSDFGSRIPKEPAARSQLSDLASDLRSYLVGVSGTLSDVYSMLSDFQSDFGSRIPKEPAARSQLSDLASDIASDLKSFIGAGVSLDASTISDIRSAIAATELDASDLSDIASAVWARTGSDPAAVPGTGAAMGAKVDWLTAMSRNKLTQTATVQSLRNDTDSADIGSAAVSDDGVTYTREKFG